MFYLPYKASKVHRYSSVMVLTPLLVGMLEVQILSLLNELFACGTLTGRDRGSRQRVRKSTIACAVSVSLMGLIFQPRCLNIWIDVVRLVCLSVVRFSMLILSLSLRASSSVSSIVINDQDVAAASSIPVDSDLGDGSYSSIITASRWTYPLVSFYGHMTCIMCHFMRRV